MAMFDPGEPIEEHERRLAETRTKMRERLWLRRSVLDDITDERSRQIDKWDQQQHPDGTSPNYEPRATHYRKVCDANAERPEGCSWMDILQEETNEAYAEIAWPALRKELVQSAAVIVAWIEDGDDRQTRT